MFAMKTLAPQNGATLLGFPITEIAIPENAVTLAF